MLQLILEAALGDPLNRTFVLAILGLATLAILGLLERSGPLGRLAAVAPGLLTALGVLGTFVGILVGLLGFDVSDVSRSVPRLLDGMKTAFVTSVFGMGAAILVRLIAEVLVRSDARTTGSAGVEDVLRALDGLLRESQRSRTELLASLERVRQGLTGDAQGSLVTQLQGLRTEVTDEIRLGRAESLALVREVSAQLRAVAANESKAVVEAVERVRQGLTGGGEGNVAARLDALRSEVTQEIKTGRAEGNRRLDALSVEITKISATLIENTSKAIIEALEGSIRDFNKQITEQFGDNFRQLNVAVGRLLEWQEGYRQQMIANAQALREGAEGLQAARSGLEAVGSQAVALVRAAEDMKGLLDGLGKSRAELDARLAAFRDMAAAAGAAVPTLQARVEELTTHFSRQVEAVSSRIGQVVEGLQTGVRAHEEGLRAATSRFTEAVTQSSTRAASAAAEAAAQQERMLGELARGYERMRDDAAVVGSDLRGAVKLAGDALRASLEETVRETQKVNGDAVRAVAQQLQNTTKDEFGRIADGLSGQVKQLDERLRQELERALEGLGTQLVSLTGKFVEDYTILTRRMDEAVNAVRRDAA